MNANPRSLPLHILESRVVPALILAIGVQGIVIEIWKLGTDRDAMLLPTGDFSSYPLGNCPSPGAVKCSSGAGGGGRRPYIARGAEQVIPTRVRVSGLINTLTLHLLCR